ncbi:dehydrogenase [Paraburkholderia phytofirmans OLGA172]|uniref:Dehydrogenase n=1 Tax=Paraburkholderia phytofirmans OLGA172 TaxID=1417228 RepID=A0A160FVY4_9BURK|nr:SDR family oxidoreductase [Paraburkholderia phytofirmans]ANB77520.1 dehydrogenase [Paraburkholderia phytofirmans OLGA172]
MTDYKKLFQLDGKVALVTGAAGGIGSEACRALASAGAAVLVTDFSAEKGSAIAEELRSAGARAEFFKLDVTSDQAWQNAVEKAREEFNGLDILVNNAGSQKLHFLCDHPLEDLHTVLNTNLVGTFLGCQHAVRAMRPGGVVGRGGSIINLASALAMTGAIASASYCASKGGVLSMTRAVAVECAQLKFGIRCNAILPGLTRTEMASSFLDDFAKLGLFETAEQSEAAFLATIPNGTWGLPRDIAGAMVYLAADISRHVTGTHVSVDGGYLAL